ncbi:hypothetical protein SFBM_1313 [Candidatus Arthromitus sp. SFB-mouse-Japan]|jgi:hypothetical protein|uniref:DUF4363 family protein n=1 Tax=unclassified Candidatus Neoarthromitus TaxID=2638829 RepID=UPI00021B80FF|nr:MULTISPECIES: DUF4363 family protein [unclassified Candidatus Arthromitus]EIA22909.1 hypothetical protein SFB3_328G4 [Candidatus Arthromitus sp. SFB-3]EIA24949.1 hypothetical protein SFB2_049G7 [Candidatus Arthromitus sp. SFB-2]EIA26853.1 hypothetical protein SFB5_243G10 [Candidatus Arthromitus sp. SFB-5]EIA27993.1 hypothetical protein SFB6_076G5 [Candidatus Arthromitus sp. SFB-co]EIA30090.1 hypothetical protein SFBSU_007G229 [Candidatus Arthromitus sp. SFB-mouse-SU]EIA30290.1 hypothetical
MKFNIKNISVYGSYTLLILLIIFSFLYVKQSTYQINKKLDVIKISLENDDWDSSISLFSEFELMHKKELECFSLFSNKNDLHEVLLSIKDISTNMAMKNRDICLSKIEILKFYIEHIYDSQIPKIRNIL